MSTDADALETRRIWLFLAFAFGIAWAVGIIIYLTGGLGAGGPELLPGVPLSLALLATGYMFAPAVANVLTRVATGEGWADLFVRPKIRRGWRAGSRPRS